MGPSLESLPIEVHIEIANMLSLKDLGRLSTCSKKLNEFYSSRLSKKQGQKFWDAILWNVF